MTHPSVPLCVIDAGFHIKTYNYVILEDYFFSVTNNFCLLLCFDFCSSFKK